MIKVKVNDKQIIITGHAGYADKGYDIVCASASAIVITSANAALNIEENSIKYIEEKDKITIEILSNNENVLIIIKNMIDMLKELAKDYPKNVKLFN